MGTNYTPNHFIRQTPHPLLEQYFQRKQISPQVVIEIESEDESKQQKTITISELEEKQFEPVIKLIEAQNQDMQAEIEKDFRDINERACKAGLICLIEESRFEEHQLDIADDLEQMGNHYERAMWVFLNHPKVFKNSGNFQKMDGSRK